MVFLRRHSPVTRRDVLAGLLAIVTSKSIVAQESRPATRPTLTGARAAAIRTACDGLLARTVRSSFGWGWSETEQGIDLLKSRPKGKPPSVDTVLTARIGMAFQLAGEALSDRALLSAAGEAGRGTLALQTRTGQIREKGILGAFGGAKDDAGDPPDRLPTRMALGLLLTLLDAKATPDPRLRGPTQRAAHWLAEQQNALGGWPSLYPPEAPKGTGAKLLRLDDRDFRDSALSLLLASEVLEDQQLAGYFDRAADQLLNCRVWAGQPARRALWCGGYKLDGDTKIRSVDFPVGIDLLATRRAAEVLLAGYVFTLKSKYDAPLKDLLDSLQPLARSGDKSYSRRYEISSLRPITPPSTQPLSLFAPAIKQPLTDPVAADMLLAQLQKAGKQGGKRLADEMSSSIPLRRRLQLTVTQFADDLLVHDLPTSRISHPVTDVPPGPLSATVDAIWDDLRLGTWR